MHAVNLPMLIKKCKLNYQEPNANRLAYNSSPIISVQNKTNPFLANARKRKTKNNIEAIKRQELCIKQLK